MGEDVDDAQAHQRRQPDRRAHVVAEDQEGRDVGQEGAVERHARSRSRPCRVRGCRSADCARRTDPPPRRRPARRSPPPFTIVLFDSARSAEPPIRNGSAAVARWITSPECTRVAAFLSSQPAASCCVKPAETRRSRCASQESASAGFALRHAASSASRVLRSARFASMQLANHARTSSGTKKVGSCGQPSASLVARTSSAPSGAPCVLDLPGEIRAAVADRRPHQDQRRALGLGARRVDRARERRVVVAVGDALDVPLLRAEAGRDVFA